MLPSLKASAQLQVGHNIRGNSMEQDVIYPSSGTYGARFNLDFHVQKFRSAALNSFTSEP